jgi:tetratricopeptide (TPR) repeat protein
MVSMNYGMNRVAAIPIVVSAVLLVQLSCVHSVPPVPVVSVDGLDSDVRDAIRTARDQAVAQPKSGRASGNLGMVLEAHELYRPAILAYQRAIRLEPKEFAWRYYLALSLQQDSQLQPALAAISDALRIHPDYSPAVLKHAELLFRLGRFPESESVLEPLLAQSPHSAAVLYQMARTKFARQDFAAAEDFYRRACEVFPAYGAAWYGLAETERRLGHNADTAKNFELAESYKNSNPPADDQLFDQVRKLATGIQSRLIDAKKLMDRKQFDEASRLFKEVLKQYPENPECLVNLLFMAQYPNQSTPQEVEELYATAVRVSPQIPQVYVYYGTALASQGKYDAAAAAIEKGIALKLDDAEAHAWLADVRVRQNRPEQAIGQYRLALAAQPGFRAARVQLGKILLHAGRSSEAIPVLLPALEVQDSNRPVVLMFLTQAYANLGDRQRAREYLEQAHAEVLRNGPPNLLPQIEQGLKLLK